VLVAARIDKGPDNVGGYVGSDVQLKCTFHHKSCVDAIWSRIEPTGTTVTGSSSVVYAFNKTILTYDGRYDVSVSMNGVCTLNIRRLELEDAGTFTCSEPESHPEAGQKLQYTATLTVVGMFAGQKYLFVMAKSVSYASSFIVAVVEYTSKDGQQKFLNAKIIFVVYFVCNRFAVTNTFCTGKYN